MCARASLTPPRSFLPSSPSAPAAACRSSSASPTWPAPKAGACSDRFVSADERRCARSLEQCVGGSGAVAALAVDVREKLDVARLQLRVRRRLALRCRPAVWRCVDVDDARQTAAAAVVATPTSATTTTLLRRAARATTRRPSIATTSRWRCASSTSRWCRSRISLTSLHFSSLIFFLFAYNFNFSRRYAKRFRMFDLQVCCSVFQSRG